MQITGTHINYYLVCHRKLWLFAHSIQMEHTHDAVIEGKLIHENSYQDRPSKYEEIQVEGIKIDFYDTRKKIVHEIKKSSKMEEAHLWQLKYYLHVLRRNGIDAQSGILEYPKERKTEEVFLTSIDEERIREMEKEIEKLIQTDHVPGKINKSTCKKCSYYDFCYITEEESP